MSRVKFFEKIAKVQDEVGVLEKSCNNPFFKSKYADITSMLKQIVPILRKHKMAMIQPSRVENGITLQGTVIFDLESEYKVQSWVDMPAIEDPQKKFACSTYFRRMTLQNLLATQAEDDDGNSASGKTSSKSSTGRAKSKGISRDF